MRADRHRHTAEFAFVCACAVPGDPPPIGDRLDADVIAAIAHRHQVVPLVVEAYRHAGVPVPPTLARRFDPLAPLRAAHEAVRLRTLLEGDGIAPVFLKGSALAMLAYGALGRRQFGDIDLLVSPAEAQRAATRLERAGYRAVDGGAGTLASCVAKLAPIAKDITLYHPDGGLAVELHWRMTDDPREPPVRAREAIQQVSLAPGATIETLGTDALFTYCCAHGAAHGWARLRWLADVAALMARTPDGGDGLWRAASARRQGRAAASAILLAGRLFALAPPPSFKAPRSIRLRLLMALSYRVIVAGGGATELSRTAWRGWVEMAAKLLVATNAGDLTGWMLRLLISASDVEAAGASRWRYGLHALKRIPRLIGRRHRRRLRQAAD